jgi:hypothetical protein
VAPIYSGHVDVAPAGEDISALSPPAHIVSLADAQHLLLAAGIFLAAVLLWLGLRAAFARSGGQIRRIIALWLAAKERELRRRAETPDQ